MTTTFTRADFPPGHYRIKLGRGAPWSPVRVDYGPPVVDGVVQDRSSMWSVWINGKLAYDPSPDPLKAGCERVFPHARPIKKAEYDYLIAVGRYARAHEPDSPAANPTEAIDVNKSKPIF